MNHFKFKNFLQEKCKITDNTPILVALSGGADSMALLHLLLKSGYNCIAAHCNFSLRGIESDEDEQFVRKTCEQWNVECFTKKFDTYIYAKENKISVEMAARDLRYEWFYELADKLNIDFIATGHHGDDSVETFLLNLVRGTGLRGLTGISPQKDKLIRPLLFATSDEIKAYCAENKITYRTDSTNDDTKFVRNKIRHKLIPLFKEINPSFFRTMHNNMEYLKEVSYLYENEIEKVKKKIVSEDGDMLLISKQKLQDYSLKNSFLFELLREKGFSGTMIDNIIDSLGKTSGKQFLTEKYRLIIDRHNLILTTLKKSDSKTYYIESDNSLIDTPIQLKLKIFERTTDFIISKDPKIACFDADLLKFPLTFRHPQVGDRFKPLGMNSFKKLSDFFIDEKFTSIEKEQTWLLLNNSEIVWIIGKRIDNRYKIRKNTNRILEIFFNS